jgi:hypothetical protein
VNGRGTTVLDNGKARACTSDFSCTDLGAVCGGNKDRVRRDLVRHLDAVTVQDAVENYVAENGTCSQTSDRLCQSAGDCPAGESCMGVVPALASGTFVRGAASSTWSSWQEILGGAVNASLPLDPLNQHLGCGQGDLAGYDASTCYSAEATRYVCPAGSSAYYYRTTGLREAKLLIDLEYDNGTWMHDLADDVSPLTVDFGAGRDSYCVGRAFGAGGTCGDGVVGGNEECEPGQVGGELVACDASGDGVNDGFRAERCTAECVFAADEAAACIAPACGDGVVNAAEECDDGVNNGRYGFCGADCRRASATYCGDGVLSGQEVCDCGSADTTVPLGQRRSFGGALTCASVNGSYNTNAAATCAWDCRGAAGYCGDDQVNGAEVCDGAAGVGDVAYTGAVCTGGANDGQACTSHNDCGGGNRCGRDAVDQACVAGEQRVRACTAACQLPAWSACQRASTRNGIVEAGEECDDNNENDNDSCKNDFTLNVCGDGVMNPAAEQCDVGAQNGQECSAEYGSTCSACSTSCRLVVQSGDYCGDGERNGQEYCDAGAVPMRYVNLSTDALGAECSTPGAVLGDDTCGTVGVCNGGTDNGGLCLLGGAACAGGGECVAPQCASSCLSACPATFQTAALGLTPNQPGARPVNNLALYSYESFSEEPGAVAQVPNIGTLTIPACRAASSLRADVRTSGITRPDAYVVFVTDRSLSMNTLLPGGSSRMQVTRSALEDSIGQLFDELGEQVHIALVSYSNLSGQGICQGGNYGTCKSAANCANGYTCDLLEGFYGSDDEVALVDMVNSYTPFSSTNTHLGLDDARVLLRDNAPTGGANPPRKVVVLLTDGDANDEPATLAASNAIKSAGYEFYTIGITSSGSLITRLNGWSSNGPDNWNGVTTVANPPLEGPDYSFSGTTSEAVRSFYEHIVDSITGFTLTLMGLEGSATVIGEESGTVTFTLPSTFRCDPARSQQLPIKPVFRGLGALEIMNVRFDHCPL